MRPFLTTRNAQTDFFLVTRRSINSFLFFSFFSSIIILLCFAFFSVCFFICLFVYLFTRFFVAGSFSVVMVVADRECDKYSSYYFRCRLTCCCVNLNTTTYQKALQGERTRMRYFARQMHDRVCLLLLLFSFF